MYKQLHDNIENAYYNEKYRKKSLIRSKFMNLEEAKQSIGKMVMSTDAGYKLIRRVSKPHGPYRLLKVTKAGFAILEGHEEHRIPSNLLERGDSDAERQPPTS